MTRVHDVIAFPAMRDWDGAGHAVNVIDLVEGHWPDPHSWAGSHPPLHYLVCALLWWLLPDAVPVHVTMRLVSAGAWIGTVALVWRALARLRTRVDATIVAVVLLGIPGFTIVSCMLTNDALCALFVTATLVRLVATPRDRMPAATDVALTAVVAGLAAATKATGLAAVGVAGAFYALRARSAPARAARLVAVFAVASGLFAVPHYVHLFTVLSGSPYEIMTISAGSQEKRVVELFVHALARARVGSGSLWTLFHAALWDDPTTVYLPAVVETHPLARAVWAGGLIVTGTAVAGTLCALLRRELRSAAAVALAFGVLFAAAAVPHAARYPYVVLTKTNYLLPEALPLGLVLLFGLGATRGALRVALRCVLLTVAAAGVALTVYGWWAPPTPARAADRPAGLVERYFQYRVADPIRALSLLGPDVQLAHGLDLLYVLGLPPLPPSTTLAPEEERRRDLGRARVAWLELYNLVPWMTAVASGLEPTVVADGEHDGMTELRVRVTARIPTRPPGGDLGLWPFPPFEERFTVARLGHADRITRIEQTGVVDENAVEAFAAHPTRGGFEHLRAIGWQPPLAGAAAALGFVPGTPRERN